MTVGAFTQSQSHSIYQSYRVQDLFDDFEVPGNPDTLVAHRPGAQGRRRRGVRRAHVRHHRQVLRHGRHPLLRIREFAQGLLRLWRGLLLRHGRGGMLRGLGSVPPRALHEPRQDDEGRRQHQALQRHLACHRRRDVVCHVVGRFPSGRHQSPRHAAAVQGGLPDQLRRSASRRSWRTTACASTARCSRKTGTTSSIRSSAPTVSRKSAMPARRASRASRRTSCGASRMPSRCRARSRCSTRSRRRTIAAPPTTRVRNEGEIVTDCDDPLAPVGTFLQAPAGQELPVQAKFKANAVGRYEFAMAGMDAHLQARVGLLRRGVDRPAHRRARAAGQTTVVRHRRLRIWRGEGELGTRAVREERIRRTRRAVALHRVFGVQAVDPDNDPAPNTVPLCGLQPYTVTTLPRTVGVTFSKKF